MNDRRRSMLNKLVIVALSFCVLCLGYGRFGIGWKMSSTEDTTTTAFLQSIKKGDVDQVKAFLKSGMNPNERDNQFRTALFVAEAKGHQQIRELLLNHGADANAPDPSGVERRTGMMLNASMRTYLEAIDKDRVKEEAF